MTFELVAVEGEIDFFNSVALCRSAEGSFGTGCAAAEENAVGWCHRRMIAGRGRSS
jgi:hypothetical protein